MLGGDNTCQSFYYLVEAYVPLVMSPGAMSATLSSSLQRSIMFHPHVDNRRQIFKNQNRINATSSLKVKFPNLGFIKYDLI